MEVENFKPFLGYNYFNRFEKSNNFSRFVCPYGFEVFSEDDIFVLSKNDNNIFNFKDEQNGHQKLKSWVDGSVLVSSKSRSFYIYEISYEISGRRYNITGIVGALKIPSEDEDYVRVCEEVLEQDISKNYSFLENNGFLSSPIVAEYEDDKNIKFLNLIKNKTSASYIFKAKQNNVVHKIWKIFEETEIEIVKNFFKDKRYFIVAGAEKYLAAVKYKDSFNCKKEQLDEMPSNYVMAYLFPKDGFSSTYLPIHRVVKDIDMFDGEDMLNKASKYFDIIHCKTLDSMRRTMFNFKRQGTNAFGIYVDDVYSVLVFKGVGDVEKTCLGLDSYKKLDLVVLNKLFFEKALEGLNIDSKKVGYVDEDIDAVLEVDEAKACFAVFLSALRSSEIFNIVKDDVKLPLKSFSFFPKPVEGLLFYLYNNYNNRYI